MIVVGIDVNMKLIVLTTIIVFFNGQKEVVLIKRYLNSGQNRVCLFVRSKPIH